MISNTIQTVRHAFQALQQRICSHLEAEEKKKTFQQQKWSYPTGGGGDSRILSFGALIEKAGVNFSHIEGPSLPPAATLKRPGLTDQPFQALGVSVVVHPQNPYIPTSHLNIRLISVQRADQSIAWWFGGGYDLTPCYGFTEDCHDWHMTASQTCQPFGADVYQQYKKNCDQYFYLPHRQETRGIGGLFFDDVNQWEFERCLQFVTAIGNSYLSSYLQLIQRRKTHQYGPNEKQFQRYRRGRYVEFNLLYDRGTLFGLQSQGATESILMSLPPSVEWQYNWGLHPGSIEENFSKKYLKPTDWLNPKFASNTQRSTL
ncbi:MAG: oxygen-dependent coproporphyrinogen oxidase [Endozoicomonadaceae bacterium]|nr:oxygen-dependent coproporphyrinogen oxidase [Endozoicomonadaceae bacterium]